MKQFLTKHEKLVNSYIQNSNILKEILQIKVFKTSI